MPGTVVRDALEYKLVTSGAADGWVEVLWPGYVTIEAEGTDADAVISVSEASDGSDPVEIVTLNAGDSTVTTFLDGKYVSAAFGVGTAGEVAVRLPHDRRTRGERPAQA